MLQIGKKPEIWRMCQTSGSFFYLMATRKMDVCLHRRPFDDCWS